MGPTRTPSYTGLHYVMVFVDDFSRFTWVYFLKHKSEALSKFVQFKEQVEKEFGLSIKCLHTKEFGLSIKCLRTDNGGEYMSDAGSMGFCVK